jgi:hypothetical protein
MLTRPKSVLLLIVVFGWSFAKDFELLFRGSGTADRVLFEHVGLGWLAVALLSVLALLDLIAVGYLIKPAPIGRFVCLTSIGVSAALTSIGFALARLYPDVARQAIIASRESRGLPVQTEVIDAALDPTMSLVLSLASLAVSGALAALVIWNSPYFFEAPVVPSDDPSSSDGA